MLARSRVNFARICARVCPRQGSIFRMNTAARAFTIVGGGRVGSAIADMGDGSDVIVRRNEPVDGPQGPIVVCTRNDALDTVVDNTPEERRRDLLFIQNGMLLPWLEKRGLSDNTVALIYFAVAKMGEAPTDGITDANPDGLTAVCGEHAEAFADRLRSAGLTCKVQGKTDFLKGMLEKLIWICAFMLVGAKHGGCTVGEVDAKHRDEVTTLIDELAQAGETELGIKLDTGYVERLCAYARSVAHFPTAVKEFQWRNGWFYDISMRAVEQGKPDPCPLHSDWLKTFV